VSGGKGKGVNVLQRTTADFTNATDG
jgi:hypothetical protein